MSYIYRLSIPLQPPCYAGWYYWTPLFIVADRLVMQLGGGKVKFSPRGLNIVSEFFQGYELPIKVYFFNWVLLRGLLLPIRIFPGSFLQSEENLGRMVKEYLKVEFLS
jgi:hypothetical protein